MSRRTDSKPAKIAFVSTMDGAPWGGSEELWSQAALRMLRDKREVCVSLPDWGRPPEPVREIMAAGASVAFRPRRKSPVQRLLGLVSKKRFGDPEARANVAWLRREAPDLVVISQGGPWDGIPWTEACREAGVPYCPLVHANSERWWPMDSALDRISTAFGSALRVFFVSNENKRLAELQCGARLPHGVVVINPWKVDADSPVPWPEDDGVTRLACVGRVDPQAKGQDVILQVMAMQKWRDRPVRVSIYGGGPCVRSVEATRKLLELDNVGFAGHVSDVNGIWRDNHALVLPSRYEGLPLVIVEAMLCGRPVITTDVAGNAQFITDGVNGFVAAAPTAPLFDEALERAWSRRAEWREIGRRAGDDLRRILPKDPVGEFVTLVDSLARSSEPA